MSRPLNGADSADAWVPRPYRVLMADEAGSRIEVRVPAALGPHDARNQARHIQPDYQPIHTEMVPA